MTGNRWGVRVVTALALVMVMTSCTGGDDDAEGATSAAKARADLNTAARATAGEPTLRFRTKLDATLPEPFGGLSTRTGAFDRVHRRGSATVVAPVGDIPTRLRRVHFRLLEGTFWQRWGPSGRRWTGTDAASLTAVPGNALVGAADAGVIARALSDAVVRVRGVSDGPGGSKVWAVKLDGDQLGRLSTPDATYRLLSDAGFAGTTGVRVDGRVTVDREGRLVRVEADLSDWWRAALPETDVAVTKSLVVRAAYTFDRFGESIVVTAPCADPETDLGYRFPVLVCPG